ncbi:hypothetical protein [Oscillospiraceae bacterium]|nr:hypothetical protein [Oscillospiraceae bacterium]
MDFIFLKNFSRAENGCSILCIFHSISSFRIQFILIGSKLPNLSLLFPRNAEN